MSGPLKPVVDRSLPQHSDGSVARRRGGLRRPAPQMALDQLAARFAPLQIADLAYGAPTPARNFGCIAETDAGSGTTCPAGTNFALGDLPSEALLVIARGRLRLCHFGAHGHRHVVAVLEAGSVFGEMALLGQSTFDCAVEAVEPSLLCALSRADVESLVRRHPEIGLRLMETLGRRLLGRRDMEAPAAPRLAVRLAALLLHEADADGVVAGRSHGDWADWLGTYRETISLVLGRFRDEGLVVVRPRLIRIVDRDGLHAYLDRGSDRAVT